MRCILIRIAKCLLILIGIYYLINGRYVFYSIKGDDLRKNAIHIAEEYQINVDSRYICRADRDLATAFMFQDNDKYMVIKYSKFPIVPLYRLEDKNYLGIITKCELLRQPISINTASKFIVFKGIETKQGESIVFSAEEVLWISRVIYIVYICLIPFIWKLYIREKSSNSYKKN